MPVRYYFGWGIWKDRIDLLISKLKFNNILLITGRNFAEKYGYVKEIRNIIEKHNKVFFHFRDISPNPKIEEIEKAADFAMKNNCDFILGFGGGSVMDATKAIAMMVTNSGSVWDYTMRQRKVEKDPIPFCLIPTTPATGSEFNSSSIVTNTEERRKWGIFDEKIYPTYSIVDPSLVMTLSSFNIAISCMDIITHLAEPFITGREEAELQDELTLLLIKKAMEEVKKILDNRKNKNSVMNFSYTSSLALTGIFTRGKGGFHEMHWLEHIVSGFYDNVPHAAGLAVLFLPWIEIRWSKNEKNLKKLSSYLMGKKNPKKEEFIDFLKGFYSDISLPCSLKDYGVKPEDIDIFIKEYNYLVNKFPNFFSETLDEKELRTIFEKVIIER